MIFAEAAYTARENTIGLVIALVVMALIAHGVRRGTGPILVAVGAVGIFAAFQGRITVQDSAARTGAYAGLLGLGAFVGLLATVAMGKRSA